MSGVPTAFAGNSRASLLLYRVVRLIVSGSTRLYTRMSIDGQERLPATGGYVFAPVHRSYIDTPISAWVSPRRMRFMGKDSMWKYPRLGRLFSALGAFPVSRGTADREALKRCIDVLESGEPLVLYPEGERKDGPIVQPLFDGATFVAAKAGVPIVPVGIGGSAKVMPRGAKFVFPHKVHVVVGEPFHVETNDKGRPTREMLNAATAHLYVELQRLFDEAQAVAG
ncbi:MAG: lysophospholipid acyltransferase family protein [Ilumatobacter sp.]|jgi:1-acyl-sn-glycerol-3-phosphate acyltransferase|uniref:lysophospholipid acyltransferase family protein n=1 Tax=Ilumatobacter sp. TaxID=1967498 RepID=UPI00391A05C2